MNYLIYCGPGIGDFILILPMAKCIRANDPNCNIKVITTSSKDRMVISKKLFELQDAIDEIDYYSGGEKFHSLQFLLKNGYKKYDYGFVLQYTDNENTSEFPNKLVSIASKITCGIRMKSKPHVKYDYYIEPEDGKRIADKPLLMLKAIGFPTLKYLGTLLNLSKIEKHLPPIDIDKNKKIVSLCVGTAPVSIKKNGVFLFNDSKNWDYHNWIQLSRLLVDDGFCVFLLGGKKEQDDMMPMLTEKIGDCIYNFLGTCSIIQSLSLLNISSIVVGADTGLMHCSGALNKPSLTLFGCTDYNEYLPFGEKSEYITAGIPCSPCFGTDLSVMCKEKKCMNNISVEKVYRRIKSIIHKYE